MGRAHSETVYVNQQNPAIILNTAEFQFNALPFPAGALPDLIKWTAEIFYLIYNESDERTYYIHCKRPGMKSLMLMMVINKGFNGKTSSEIHQKTLPPAYHFACVSFCKSPVESEEGNIL